MDPFLTQPKTHHWKTALILSAVIVVILAVSTLVAVPLSQRGAINRFIPTIETLVTPLTSLGSTTSQILTRKIIERVSSPATLSSGEKNIILQQFGGVGSPTWASLTPAERKAVVGALNKH